MASYIAHIADGGREQSIEDHLSGTANLSASFAKEFAAEEPGRFVGLVESSK